MLLALAADEFPEAALHRSTALASALGAELYVVRVVPPLERESGLRRIGDPPRAFVTFQRTLACARTTRAWLRELGQPIPSSRFNLRSGDFLTQVAACARDLHASLVVISARAAHDGALATALAKHACACVLVAREPAPGRAIIAATDLAWRDLPVLRRAGALSLRLSAPMVAIHNLAPLGAYVSSGMGAPVVCEANPELETQRRTRLLEAARVLAVNFEAVVSTERDAAGAILNAAQAREVDLIVVGTNRRSWFVRFLGDGVATAVVDRARSSVLVVPLAARRTSARPLAFS